MKLSNREKSKYNKLMSIDRALALKYSVAVKIQKTAETKKDMIGDPSETNFHNLLKESESFLNEANNALKNK